MLKLFSNKKINFLSSISIIILLVCIINIYFPLTKTFYQQDEWLGLGTYLVSGTKYLTSATSSLFGILWGEGRILSSLLYYFSFKFFPLDILPIALFSLFFHFVNAVLVFFLIKRIFGKVFPSLMGSLFFALNSVSQGAVTWAGAVGGTLPSTALILLAVFLYFNYIETNKKKWLLKSFVLIYISLHFKESGVFLFLLLPFVSLLFKKYSRDKFIRTYWYYLLAVLIVAIIRIIGYKSIPVSQSLFLTGTSEFYYSSFAVRALLYPITSFSLSIVPPTIFLNFARYVTNVYYPFFPEEQFILIAQTVVLDLVSIVLSVGIFALIISLLRKTNKKIKKQILFWLIFILTSFLPYIIISKSYAYLDSRYYYLASVGWAVMFGWFFTFEFNKMKNKYSRILVVSVFVLFLNAHAKTVAADLDLLVKESQIRIGILNQMKNLIPTLEENINVFYVAGDTDYLLTGNKIPFQHGFGYTLMIIYYDSGKIPKQLLDDGYLFELGSQGYREKDGVGFGYFSDIEIMEEAMKEYKLKKSGVNKFYYDSINKELKRF